MRKLLTMSIEFEDRGDFSSCRKQIARNVKKALDAIEYRGLVYGFDSDFAYRFNLVSLDSEIDEDLD